MKRQDLKVGDKIIQNIGGWASGYPLKITDLNRDEEFIVVGMGFYGCAYNTVQNCHMFAKEDGTLEEITAEYVITYETGDFVRETYIDAPNYEQAIARFINTVGNYKIQTCTLSEEDY